MDRFLFDVRDDPSEDDDVIGCVSEDQRNCICIVCGANCIYRGCLRNETEEVA